MLQKGDLVRITGRAFGPAKSAFKYKGQLGRVLNVWSASCRVIFSDMGAQNFPKEAVELAPPITYRCGDQLRVVTGPSAGNYIHVVFEGEVTNNLTEFNIETPQGRVNYQDTVPDRVASLEKKPEPKPEEPVQLRRGDHCEVVDAGGCKPTALGDRGTIVSRAGNKSWVFIRDSDGRQTTLLRRRLKPTGEPRRVVEKRGYRWEITVPETEHEGRVDPADTTRAGLRVLRKVMGDAGMSELTLMDELEKRGEEAARRAVTQRLRELRRLRELQQNPLPEVRDGIITLYTGERPKTPEETVKFRQPFFSLTKNKEVTVKAFEIRTEHYVNNVPVSQMTTAQKIALIKEVELHIDYLKNFKGNHRIVENELDKAEKFLKDVNDLFNKELK